MNAIKKNRLRVLSLLLCLFVLGSGMPAVSAADTAVKVVLSGNLDSPNPRVTPYAALVQAYLEQRLGKETDLVSLPVMDIEQEGFLSTAEAILAEEPDMVFLEIDISQKRKGGDAAVKEKIAAAIETLLSAKKKPAVYFIYAPEETFYDYRQPFDAAAAYYGIEVLDVFSALKQRYVSGQLNTTDFLTAGLIPGEEGHRYFADEIINDLKGIGDLTKPLHADKKPLADPQKWTAKPKPDDPKLPPAHDGSEFYVSVTGGSDANPGTEEKPFKTLERARQAVRALKKKQGGAFGGATVYLREGLYRLADGFVLTAEDGGTEDAEVVYAGYPGERVRLTNAATLKPEKFRSVTDPKALARIPETARDKVLVYDLKADNIKPGTYRTGGLTVYAGHTNRNYSMGNLLTADGHLEQRAQYPNGGYSKVAETQTSSRNEVYYSEQKGERWKTADNAWLKGMLWYGYYTEYNKINGFDFEKKIIKLSNNSPSGIKAGNPWCILNLLEELDMPSEWYVDEKEEKLYYYPRGDVKQSEILFSSNPDPIITLDKTRNVVIRNMEFTTGCGAAVEINDGRANTVDGCELGNMGHSGVNINCSDIVGPGKNGVINSHIYNTAVGGVMIVGGDRKGLTAQEDYVDNCHIENFSTEVHSETGGVLAQGTVGVKITNNNIHNDNSAAVWMGGNDDFMEYNEIYNVVKETDDYGAVYGDSRGAMRQGVTFNHNYMHNVVYSGLTTGDSGFLAGFYTDAMRNNGATVHDNVFIEVRVPIFFSNNRNMEADGNLIMNCYNDAVRMWRSPYTDAALENYHKTLDERLANGTFWNATKESESVNNLLYRAYQTTPEFTKETEKTYFMKYPWLENYLITQPIEARYVTVKNNAVFDSTGKIALPNTVSQYFDTTDNYMTSDNVPYGEAGTETERIDAAMGIASEHLKTFRTWDVRKAGIDAVTPVDDFDILYPVNGQTGVNPDGLVLRWDYASGADKYLVTVATDPDFRNIVFQDTAISDYIKVTGLEYGMKQYYWKVQASAMSEKFTGTPVNANGVHSFTTQKDEVIDGSKLNEKIAEAQQFLESMTEGSEGGQYPEGSKQQLSAMVEEAVSISENPRVKQRMIDDAMSHLNAELMRAQGTVILQETDVSQMFSDPETITFVGSPGSKVSGAETEKVTQDGGALTFSGTGGVFAERELGTHEIAHFKAKFDFQGTDSGYVYTIFGTRVQDYSPYIYNVSSYVFLVTKSNIELQGFKKPGDVGKFYLTVPNTFIEEGKEHDIEFGAIPADNGRAVRILLAVDGQIVYDHLDQTNIISKGGLAGFVNATAANAVTILPPDQDLPYPSLLERLNDPDSDLNTK